MDNETEIIKESIKKLPSVLKTYVLGNTWSLKADLIEQTNQLTDEQSGSFKGEIFLVLAGIENYSDFTANVKSNVLGIDSQKTFMLVADVEKNIFAEIKSDLLEVEKN